MKTGFLDWTENNINLYVFDKRAGLYNLIDSSSLPLEGKLNPETLKSLPTAGCEDFFLSIPADLLTLREQSFPFSGREKIRDTLSYELEGILLGSVSDYSVDHLVTESFDVGAKVLAVCLEKKKLKEIINVFSAANIEPRVITSLDLRLSGGRSEILIEETFSDNKKRAEEAGAEILNPSINLRQDELSYMGDIVKFARKLRATIILLLILATVLAANSTLGLITMSEEQRLLGNKIDSAYRQVFPEDKKIIDPERQFKGNVNMLLKKKAALGGIPVIDILRDIALQKSRDITLHEFNADGKNIIMKGAARSFEDVESLKDTLSSFFKQVKVTDSDAAADKKINFTIIMQEKTA